ncbi:MAG: competence protein, partial [Rikenellaceae bacterium]
MKRVKILFLAIALISFVVPLAAQGKLDAGNYSTPQKSVDIKSLPVSDLWDRANTAYANENYLSAKRMYNEIFSRGVHSAEIYYNLGNVNYKRGQIGASLLNYYRAQRLNPSDEDIQHNIDVVSLSVKDNITPMPRLFLLKWNDQIASWLNCEAWSIVSLVSFGLVLALVLCYLLASSLMVRRVGFMGGVVMMMLFVVSTCYALGARADMLN